MILDNNGEPRVFRNNCSEERNGKDMNNNEIISFLVDCLSTIYEEQGIKIIKTNKTIGNEYPNLIIESRNGKLYYVIIDFSIFPYENGIYKNQSFDKFISLAHQFNSFPTKANIGLFCLNTDGAPAVCGGDFVLKFGGLEEVK